jgi:16S rRNA (guanine(966)-N(2))-methyltransferase RsmD
MRIIGGKFKGRRFDPPADKWPTRPTTDVSKEALFNILENTFDFDRLKVLDLFCGTGSHTYEFASRGCTDITCVDKHPPCISFVKKMIKELDIEPHVNVVQADVFQFIKMNRIQYKYIFAGPPYPLTTMDTIPGLVVEYNLLMPGGWFIMEHNPQHNYEDHPWYIDARKYGQTIFSIFERPE